MRWRIGILDVVLIGGLIVVGTGLIIAVRRHEMRLANRIQCAKQLQAIGQALLLYSNENRNAYPRTRISKDDFPNVTWGTPYDTDASLGAVDGADPFADPAKVMAAQLRVIPADNDITAAMWLLVRTKYLAPNGFVCPSTGQTGWDMEGAPATHWTNWKGRDALRGHLSYSMMNVYRSTRARKMDGSFLRSSPSAETPLFADMNPGSTELATLVQTSTPALQKRGNSPNHGGEGQNVLYADGHAEFMTTSFCGEYRDNIYRVDPPPTTQRTWAIDSLLLPKAADLGR